MIDKLAVQYKKTGYLSVRDALFNKLLPTIKEKAKYVYWYKSYKLYDKVCKVKHLYSITQEDIFQELCLDVLTWIENFNSNGSFSTYVFSCLWNWRPKIINKETYMNLKSIKCMSLTSEQKENFMDSLSKEIKFDIRIGVNTLLDSVKGSNEKAVLKLLYINPDIPKKDIAKILGVSSGRVTQIFSNLKKNKGLYEFIKKDL